MKRGSTIKLSGPGLNDHFAREMLKTMRPDQARSKVSGPALKALERAIGAREGRVYCPCADWGDNLPNGQTGGKPFEYCPWCGNGVLENSRPTSSEKS